MEKKISYGVMLLYVLMLTTGCKKDSLTMNKSVQETITGYFDIKDQLNNNGSIGFNAYKTNFGENAGTVYQINGALKDVNGTQLNLGKLMVNDIAIEANSQGRYNTGGQLMDQVKTFFGKEVNLKSYKPKADLSIRDVELVLEGNLKLPMDIFVSSPTLASTGRSINRRQIVTWNADPNNTRKVVIAIVFDPTKKDNKSLNSNRPTANYIEVNDNGQYQLTPDNFKNIPNKATISIFVARGNYTKVTSTNGKEKYTIYGYSAAEQKFIVE